MKAGSLGDMGEKETTRRHWGVRGARYGYIGRKRTVGRRVGVMMWEKGKIRGYGTSERRGNSCWESW